MKKFIDKLIERLEDEIDLNPIYDYEKGHSRAICDAIEIVNQLAEEYSKDQNWQTTRNYLDEKYFSKIRELSAKYNHPCEDIPISFDWVFGLIEKIENQLAEEYKTSFVDGLVEARRNCSEDSVCSECPFGQIEDRCILAELQIDADIKKNNGWIPCSELPEEDGMYLCTVFHADDYVVWIMRFNDGEFLKPDDVEDWNYELLAWKPIAPYQPKGE